MHAVGARVDESQLTGEADDVVKDPVDDPRMLSGSKVVEGDGLMVVTSVGVHSQAGMIFSALQQKGGGEDSLR